MSSKRRRPRKGSKLKIGSTTKDVKSVEGLMDMFTKQEGKKGKLINNKVK